MNTRRFFGLGLALLASRVVSGAVCSDYGGISTEVDGFDDVCCSENCSPCGGSGCNVGGARRCCVGTITNAGNVCSEDTAAPCLLGPTPAPATPVPTPALTATPATGVCGGYGGIPTEIEGYEDVCCSESCGECGGSGCSSRTGGARRCCVGTITTAGDMCSEDTDAPCLLSSTTATPVPTPVQTPAPTTTSATGVCGGYGGIPTEIEGYEDVCCSASCEFCGGSGCKFNAGGARRCCVGTITNAGDMCSEDTDAPCLLSPDDQVEAECDMSTLPDATQEQLSIYDKSVYVEPECVNGNTTALPVHCNHMGMGQQCRGCYLTCDGAMKYMEDFAVEIAEWGVDAIIHFCDEAEVDDLEDCA